MQLLHHKPIGQTIIENENKRTNKLIDFWTSHIDILIFLTKKQTKKTLS